MKQSQSRNSLDGRPVETQYLASLNPGAANDPCPAKQSQPVGRANGGHAPPYETVQNKANFRARQAVGSAHPAKSLTASLRSRPVLRNKANLAGGGSQEMVMHPTTGDDAGWNRRAQRISRPTSVRSSISAGASLRFFASSVSLSIIPVIGASLMASNSSVNRNWPLVVVCPIRDSAPSE